MQCSRCGQESAETAQFCAACGQSLLQSGAVAAAAEPGRAYGVPPLDLSGGPGATPAGGPPQAFAAPCRVCGMLVSSQTDRCPRCGTPVGMIVNSNDPTATAYLPASGAPAGIALQGANTSGEHGEVPPELQGGWNWGAAFVTFFWSITHRVWWYVGLQFALFFWGLFIGIVGNLNKDLVPFILGNNLVTFALWIGFRIYFGTRGNAIAWQYRRFENPYHCLYVQDAWKPWGIVLFVLAMLFLLCIIAFTVFVAVIALGMK